MDVVYEIDIENKFLKDSDMAARMTAVVLTPVLSERADDFTLVGSPVTIPAPGIIRRTITATLTADFMAKYPTNDQKRAQLSDVFRAFFYLNLPGEVTETITLV